MWITGREHENPTFLHTFVANALISATSVGRKAVKARTKGDPEVEGEKRGVRGSIRGDVGIYECGIRGVLRLRAVASEGKEVV